MNYDKRKKYILLFLFLNIIIKFIIDINILSKLRNLYTSIN